MLAVLAWMDPKGFGANPIPEAIRNHPKFPVKPFTKDQVNKVRSEMDKFHHRYGK